jgi:hypothetical protein
MQPSPTFSGFTPLNPGYWLITLARDETGGALRQTKTVRF